MWATICGRPLWMPLLSVDLYLYRDSFIYAYSTGWSPIAEIIVRGEAEVNYLIFNRTSTCGIRVFYHVTFNNLYHFQLCWIVEGLHTFSITLIVTIAFRHILNRHIFANLSNYTLTN